MITLKIGQNTNINRYCLNNITYTSLHQVAEVIASAMTIPLSPLEDTIVPDTLITPEELAAKAALTHPAFVPLDGKVTLLELFPFLFPSFQLLECGTFHSQFHHKL
jgi:hypothetical protein